MRFLNNRNNNNEEKARQTKRCIQLGWKYNSTLYKSIFAASHKRIRPPFRIVLNRLCTYFQRRCKAKYLCVYAKVLQEEMERLLS